MSYSHEFKVIIATIYGEAGASSRRSWEVIAHSIRNRIGFGNWTQFTTMYGIVTKTGFDAYTHKTGPYLNALSILNTNDFTSNTGEIIQDIIDTVKPIYEGKIKDDTDGVVFYWSPRAQKQLHKSKPKVYTSAIPNWTNDNKKVIVQIPGTEGDDFQWLKFIRSRMFITLYGTNGLPLVEKKVDIRFADGKKVPLLSDLETNSKGQLPAFYARIEMGVRLLIDGKYLKDNKGNNIRILPTGKDVSALIVVDTSEGYKSSLEIHETGSIASNNNEVNITNTNSSNNTNANTYKTNLLSEVNFKIKLIEADTKKPLPNTTYYLEYKNNIKPHTTNDSGVDENIKADICESINFLLDDDNGKQPIDELAFGVTEELNQQTKVIKIPVVSFNVNFVDKKGVAIPRYKFKTLYRGRESELKTANNQGVYKIKALAGQKITFIDEYGRYRTSCIVTNGAKNWKIIIGKNITEDDINQVLDKNLTIEDTSDKDEFEEEQEVIEQPAIEVEKPQVIETEKIKEDGPTLEVKSTEANITIKFIDEATDKPLSGLSYYTESTKYGKNSSITGSDGTRGRPHESLVGVEIKVIVVEDGNEVVKGTIVADSDREDPYVYKAKKPEYENGIITFNIYTNFKIIKNIPRNIYPSNTNKFKYVFYDENEKKHDICTVEWNKTKEKSVGHKRSSKPTHSKIIYDKRVQDGQTHRRVKYENGDIAEYGINKGKYFWRLFIAQQSDIILVRMPDSLNYNKNNIKVAYSFSNTKRRYTSPGHLACFIGALASTGIKMISTGSCFKEGTGFPSYSHNNGRSIDTKYLSSKSNQQKYINAMKNFGCYKQLQGKNIHRYQNTTPADYHNDHLHSMFDDKRIIIIKE